MLDTYLLDSPVHLKSATDQQPLKISQQNQPVNLPGGAH